jgi:spore germination protein YaaH
MTKKLLFGLFAGVFFMPQNLHAQTDGHLKKGPVGVSGWVTFWDDGHKSIASFEKHAGQIDRAYFEWYKCGPDGLPMPVTEATEELKAEVMAVAAKNGVEPWYMTGNFDPSIHSHNGARIEKFLYDDALRAKHIQMLVDIAKKYGVKGVQIDYENLKAADKDAFSKFMAELDKAAQAGGFKTGIALPPKVDEKGTWDDPQSRDYPAIGQAVDELVPMTYDCHWSTSAAGNITSPEWSEMCAKYTASTMPPEKVELGYPVYGYDWVGTNGNTILWAQFMDLASKYKVNPVRDTDYSQELKIDYTDEKGSRHEAWMTDSYCLEAECNIVKRNHLYGLGVWYFGAEDESFWTTMKQVNATSEETHLVPSSDESQEAANAALETKDLITDTTAPDYTYAYPDSGSKVTVVENKGKRWLDVSLKGDDWSGFGVGMSRKNLAPYLKTGALQFYVRGAKGGENSTVGFIMEKGPAEDEKYSLVDEVPLDRYVQVTSQWQWVTIPLSDFPEEGYHHDNATNSKITGSFKWERVLEFTGNHAPTADPQCEIFFSSVRIIPTYDPGLVKRIDSKP